MPCWWWVKSGCIFLVYRRGKRKEWVASAGGRQSARVDGAGRVRARRGVLPLQPAAGGWWDELTTLRQRASWRVKAASAAVVWLVCAMGGRRAGSGTAGSGGFSRVTGGGAGSRGEEAGAGVVVYRRGKSASAAVGGVDGMRGGERGDQVAGAGVRFGGLPRGKRRERVWDV